MKTRLLCLVAALLLFAGGASALDERIIRDIDRADTLSELLTLTDDITKAQGVKKAASTEDAIQIAVDTQVYLTYIRIKIEKLRYDQFQLFLERPLSTLPEPR